MTAAVAGLCAAGAALALLHRPPRPGRLHRPRVRRPVTPTGALEAIGRAVRRTLLRPPDPAADRFVGAALALALVAVAAGVELAVAVAAVALLRRWWKRVRSTRSAPARPDVERDLPDVIDLLALAVGAGLSLPAALPVVSPLAPAALREDLAAVVDAIAGGRPTDEAVVELGRRWGAPARPFVHAIADHLRYGTPVLPALERVAVEARAGRRRAAETRARKLPVLLLFPLVFCTLPAFGLLTVAPLVAGTFDALSGSRLEAPASTGP